MAYNMFHRILPITCGFLFFLAVDQCSGHVALTFPPARPYALDFLDNFRTAGPCGMPRGLGKPLSLLAGATYIFTWNQPVLHPGGVRLELLDREYNLLETLAPVRGEVRNGQFFGNFSDPTTIYRQVTIPNMECADCVVRLLRSVGPEWEPGAETGYMFRSCADVHVRRRDAVTARDVCANNGAYNVSQRQCHCDRSRAGSSCQHEQECLADADCNGPANGRCISTDSVSFPRLQCYCQPGFFGVHCELKSAIDVNDLLIAKYQRKVMPNGFELMWRVLPALQELEVVVRANTLSWVGLGMRAAGATVACRKFPPLPTERVTDFEAFNNKGIGRRKKSGFRRNPPFLAQQQQQQLLDADFLHPMDCTDIVWGAAKDGTLSRVRDMYTRERAIPHVDEFFGGKQSLTDHPTDVAITASPMHVIMAHGQSPDANRLPELQSDDDGNPFLSQNNDFSSFLSSLSIRNYYRLDELKYHGVDSGQRGVTQINFLAGAPSQPVVVRKPATAPQQQQQRQPVSAAGNKRPTSPASPGSVPTAAVNNNNKTNLPCFGQFRTPEKCVAPDHGKNNPKTCQYAAEWYYDVKLKALRVQLFSSQPNKWLGIGWSKTGEMTNSDITTAWISSRGSHITVTDRFARGHFMPAKDKLQNSGTLSGRRIGDQSVMVEFSKPLTDKIQSGDTKADFDLTDANCFYMLYPADGGSYNEADETITQHDSTPIVSDTKICFNKCTAGHHAAARNLPKIEFANSDELDERSSVGFDT